MQNPSIIYEENQGTIILEDNRKVGICTKHIDICHHFMWDIVEDKYIDINYIPSEDKHEYIRKNNTQEADLARKMKSITEGEIWELMDTGRENEKNTCVTNDKITKYKTGYFSHALAEVVDGKHKNDWILIMISSTDK